MTWITTATGNQYDFESRERTSITIADIAWHLSQINRYLGATRYPYSVAQHSLLISEWLEDQGEGPLIQFEGLMHDSPEAYVADIPAPLKPFLGGAYRDVYAECWDRIRETVGDLPESLSPIVKEADLRICLDERAQLLAPNTRSWHPTIERADPLDVSILKWNSGEAYRAFLTRFKNLKEEIRRIKA